jgi:hypothetical protein
MMGLDLSLLKNTEHSADVPSRHIRVMAAELERLQAECARLEAENIDLRSERALRLADAERICAWDRRPWTKICRAFLYRGRGTADCLSF